MFAFYGGMPREIRLQGAPATAVQIGDVTVESAERGLLTRHGVFSGVAELRCRALARARLWTHVVATAKNMNLFTPQLCLHDNPMADSLSL